MKPIVGFRRPYWNTQPDFIHEPYRSSVLRGPTRAPIAIAATLSEVTGPDFARLVLGEHEHDLTCGHAGEPQGERIVVSGRVLDENGRPLRRSLIEMWQANAAGRYLHERDQHQAPLDPNFSGEGRALTDEDGRYRFVTIKPGAYPWRNHYNAWRPAHLHFSLFGAGFGSRLITQMYFPGDPLLAFDPIFNCVGDEQARARMVAQFDWENCINEFALAYRFDIVVRGRCQTPWEA
ncbi:MULTISPECIES: protocatechuate 3,4-dioxygenase subunit beta [unclassified Lysobacter]|uniref:protocatechuate 3,4-dioxygenase subunit beta n=1 Tax=unclassified Lysobacter TaxID=2635362 RepID=UPI001BEBB384|nr:MULTISPECIES: protocatechuate 3,4-dioxygenase subunit beta [unclassified Lysobacter]MBT2748859.1 protocatechuate 3,4-dioxygenase subunit beta [Lysobacter sp. ISL-42]MBT2751094.1 protocatechuate 3,4-dioxygenase subunit beta [Lysobacter sp. ISL-50]MBT2779640.1 protocatechuate 3,4-dioxygenase subunit beta [Lysobacter sp. ISL-54]MBT2783410.1 protocatechuate 3,4-dioxygenase subunit beta [Lysobacter sp. ISL-52]